MAAGVYRGLELSEEIKPHIYREVMYIEPGQTVERFDGANKALGILFLKFESEAQMNSMMAETALRIRPFIEAAS